VFIKSVLLEYLLIIMSPFALIGAALYKKYN